MKKLFSLFLVVVMALSMTISASAASNITDIAGHTYQSDIKELNDYGALDALVYQGQFSPDNSISEAEFINIVIRLFPGRNLGLSGSNATTTMSWACARLTQAAASLGFTSQWGQIQDTMLTRGSACMVINCWLGSNASLKEMAGRMPQVQTQSTGGFIGPDGAWYLLNNGYTYAQNGNGFWYGTNNRWYYYQNYTNYSSNTQYGYWSGGKWYNYYTNCNGYAYEYGFADVPIGSYYYDAINWMAYRGITSGTGNGNFSPDKVCSQAEVLTFIWKANGSPSTSASCPIGGLDKNSFYYTALCWAGSKGMITGSGDGADPTQVNCTRAMCVYYLWKAAGSPSVSSSYYGKFNDVPSSASYRSAVGWAVKNAITAGTSSYTFSPLDPVTRGQVAVFLYRANDVR